MCTACLKFYLSLFSKLGFEVTRVFLSICIWWAEEINLNKDK